MRILSALVKGFYKDFLSDVLPLDCRHIIKRLPYVSKIDSTLIQIWTVKYYRSNQ
jgi:hypothetical protein